VVSFHQGLGKSYNISPLFSLPTTSMSFHRYRLP
jgi:hypothetical protein